MNPWGLPDWTNPKAYPADLTYRVWRWEFLRRRNDYREAWDRWKNYATIAPPIVPTRGLLSALPYDLKTETWEPDMKGRFGVHDIYDPRESFATVMHDSNLVWVFDEQVDDPAPRNGP